MAAPRTRDRNHRRDIERRVETATEGFRHLAGLLIDQQTALAQLRTEVDTAIRRHDVTMKVAAIALDATNLIEVGE